MMPHLGPRLGHFQTMSSVDRSQPGKGMPLHIVKAAPHFVARQLLQPGSFGFDNDSIAHAKQLP
jgi:hypothetical protein